MLGENLPRRGAELLHHDLPVRFDLGHGLVRECDPETAGRDLAARRSLEDRVGGFLCAARIDRRQLPSRPDLREETVAGDFLAAAEVFAGAGVAGHDDHRVAVAFQPDQLFAILGETAMTKSARTFSGPRTISTDFSKVTVFSRRWNTLCSPLRVIGCSAGCDGVITAVTFLCKRSVSPATSRSSAPALPFQRSMRNSTGMSLVSRLPSNLISAVRTSMPSLELTLTPPFASASFVSAWNCACGQDTSYVSPFAR